MGFLNNRNRNVLAGNEFHMEGLGLVLEVPEAAGGAGGAGLEGELGSGFIS